MVPEKECRTLSTLSKICSDTPREGTHYMTVTVICGNFDPLLGLWKIGIVWPLYVRKNMEMSYFGEMFSFYSPFRPFVAFWINGWGCSPGSERPHPKPTRVPPTPGRHASRQTEISKYVYPDGKNGSCGISGGILPLTRYSLITSRLNIHFHWLFTMHSWKLLSHALEI